MIGSGLISKYRSIVSEAFINDLGKDIVVHYENPFPQTISTGIVSPYGFNTFDEFGNPTDILNLGNRVSESNTNQRIVTTTGIIRGRVYWITSQSQLGSIGLKATDKACKINIELSDTHKLNKAAYIEIEDHHGSVIKLQSVNIRHPIPYGLGESFYSISYWKVF